MTTRDIVIGLVSSVITGLAVWIIQQAYSNRKERRLEQASKTIKSVNDDKMVSDDIFWTLGPGRSVALMKQMLGVPDIFRRTDNPIFSEDWVETNSYFYMFKNAHVKITSRDDESIDSITVIPMEKSLSADALLLEDVGPTKFGELKVWPELAESPHNHKYISTMKDSFFALEQTSGPPVHHHYTFFGYSDRSYEYEESGEPKVFEGSVIIGVCVSANSEDVYYIYDYEYHSTTTRAFEAKLFPPCRNGKVFLSLIWIYLVSVMASKLKLIVCMKPQFYHSELSKNMSLSQVIKMLAGVDCTRRNILKYTRSHTNCSKIKPPNQLVVSR